MVQSGRRKRGIKPSSKQEHSSVQRPIDVKPQRELLESLGLLKHPKARWADEADDDECAIANVPVTACRQISLGDLSDHSTSASSTDGTRLLWDPIGLLATPTGSGADPLSYVSTKQRESQVHFFDAVQRLAVDEDCAMASSLLSHMHADMLESALKLQMQCGSPTSRDILGTSPSQGHVIAHRSFVANPILLTAPPAHPDLGVDPEQFHWPCPLSTAPVRASGGSQASVAVKQFLGELWLPEVPAGQHGEVDRWKDLESILVAAMPEHYAD